MRFSVLTLIPFCLLALIAYVQVRLCRRASRWYGLVLPGLSLLLSLVVVIGFLSFAIAGYETVREDESGVVHSEEDFVAPAGPLVAGALYLFVFCNVPTGLFVAIYVLWRRRMVRRQGLDRMRIQDLG